jgi:hypothetical protein
MSVALTDRGGVKHGDWRIVDDSGTCRETPLIPQISGPGRRSQNAVERQAPADEEGQIQQTESTAFELIRVVGILSAQKVLRGACR